MERGFAAGASVGTGVPRAESYLFVGMGGSGAAAMLVRDAVQPTLHTRCDLIQEPRLPAHVDAGTHVLAISHSGETEETLALVEQAKSRGCTVTGFSSGGTLPTCVDRHVPQPAGYAPRVAVAHVWSSILGFLHANGTLAGAIPVKQAAQAVRHVDARCSPRIPEADNPAKQLARAFHDRIPHIYTTPPFAGMGRFFASLLNENAKRICHVNDIPECNHNALTGWGGDPQRNRFAALLLVHDDVDETMARRIAFMRRRHHDWGVPWHEHRTAAISTFSDHIEQQAATLQFLDHVSYFAAVLRGINPAEIPEVQGLKQELRNSSS